MKMAIFDNSCQFHIAKVSGFIVNIGKEFFRLELEFKDSVAAVVKVFFVCISYKGECLCCSMYFDMFHNK